MIVLQIIGVVVVALFLAGLVAPSEAMTWWQRGNTELPSRRRARSQSLMTWPDLAESNSGPVPQRNPLPDHMAQASPTPQPARDDVETDHYVVYLSGIGTSGPDQLPVMEIPMVDALSRRLGHTTVLWDVYPYSVENQALTTGRRLSGVWRTLRQWKFDKSAGRRLAGLINLRNAFQMFVSSDRRYGPVFNLAVAQQIAAALLRHGYVPGHRKPVTLLGWSGGAQIALGATWYLAALGMQVRVLSMAGIMSSDPGIDRAEHVWHLRGDKDIISRSGAVLFARRWRLFHQSSWNRGLRSGRIQVISMGELNHVGKTGYFSGAVPLADGRTPREATLDHIVNVLVNAGLSTDRGGDAFGTIVGTSVQA